MRAGLAVGQNMARSGALHDLARPEQTPGSRRAQGRAAASREGASPALRAARAAQSAAALGRWAVAVTELGFYGLEEYLCARRAEGASAHRVRVELGCGGSVAVRLLAGE